MFILYLYQYLAISKNGYTKYYEPSYLKNHFTITQSGSDVKYTRKSDGTVIYGKLSGFATDTRETSIANAKLSELERKESTTFKGSHFVECYIIKDSVVIARDTIDVPISE